MYIYLYIYIDISYPPWTDTIAFISPFHSCQVIKHWNTLRQEAFLTPCLYFSPGDHGWTQIGLELLVRSVNEMQRILIEVWMFFSLFPVILFNINLLWDFEVEVLSRKLNVHDAQSSRHRQHIWQHDRVPWNHQGTRVYQRISQLHTITMFCWSFFQATWNDGNFARTVQRLFSDFSSKIVVICPSTVNSSTNLRTDPTTREVELELPKWREGKYLVGLPQLMVCGCWVFLWFFVGCTRFLKLTAKKSTWKRGPFFPKKGKNRIPTIPFLGVRTC